MIVTCADDPLGRWCGTVGCVGGRPRGTETPGVALRHISMGRTKASRAGRLLACLTSHTWQQGCGTDAPTQLRFGGATLLQSRLALAQLHFQSG